jgi:hypothetical protein
MSQCDGRNVFAGHTYWILPSLIAITILFSANAASALWSSPSNAAHNCAHHGGMHPVGTGSGCAWCGVRTCQYIWCSSQGSCSRVPLPAAQSPTGTKPVHGVPIVNGKPVEAPPPPPKGSNPTNAAPITSGMPTHASPGGSGGGRSK